MADLTNQGIVVSDEEIKRKFKNLTEVAEGKRAKTDLKSAMRSTLNIFRSSVQRGASMVLGSKSAVAKQGVVLKVNRSALGGRVMINKGFYYDRSGQHKWSDRELQSSEMEVAIADRGKTPYSLHWWELGTKSGTDRRGRKHGATPAKPFFKAAVTSQVGEVSQRLASSLDKIIQKEAARK